MNAKQSGDSVPVAERDRRAVEVMVCYARCWPCMCGQHPGGEHRWADSEDIEHAVSIGKPESAEGLCGCACVKEPARADDEPPDRLDDSLDAPPCPVCGAVTECGYDTEGRPMIHALGDDDDG